VGSAIHAGPDRARSRTPSGPAEVADWSVPGHWEGDLVFGRAMTAIATLVERCTRYAMLVALPDGHKAEQVADALAAITQTLPRQLARLLTWEPGQRDGPTSSLQHRHRRGCLLL